MLVLCTCSTIYVKDLPGADSFPPQTLGGELQRGDSSRRFVDIRVVGVRSVIQAVSGAMGGNSGRAFRVCSVTLMQ
jgi:hypothetical protein